MDKYQDYCGGNGTQGELFLMKAQIHSGRQFGIANIVAAVQI